MPHIVAHYDAALPFAVPFVAGMLVRTASIAAHSVLSNG